MLIDVREYPEFAAGYIQGAMLVPLARLRSEQASWNKTNPVVLVCKAGSRSETARQMLVAAGFEDVSVIPGGVDAWAAAGKPLERIEKRPWSMERQVRVVAGSLVFTTTLLGLAVSKYFFAGAAFAGAGLVFAGVSNTCMMASVLGRMPWNRARL